MSKKPIELNKSTVEQIVAKLEAAKTYPNRNALYKDIVDELVKNHGYKPFSSATIYLRVKEWNLELKTPQGKRGGGLKGNPEALKNWRESNKNGEGPKSRNVDNTKPLIQFWSKEMNGKYLKLAKSIKRGSLKAAVKLKCLECANFQLEEIKDCQCTDCPLWPVRPYKLNQIEEA